MKKTLRWGARQTILLGILLCTFHAKAQVPIPRPDHVVVLILENHSNTQIYGSADAPHLNALANGSHAAHFTLSYAITHPSQPNYLDLYAGCNQGVLLDFLPTGYPFSTPNLGAQLIDSGFTWASYCEDLPSIGWDGETSGAYVRRHNPAANWVGTGTNQIPASTNLPFSAFPTNYDSLPTVCFVAPNLNHDMHDGTVAEADDWYYANIDPYAQWAKTHNSLLIVTFDEDDGLIVSTNRILTVFVGEPVVQGTYSVSINHYMVLRTIEEMYGLPYACNAALMPTIRECWAGIAGTNPANGTTGPHMTVSPNPCMDAAWIETTEFARSTATLYSSDGKSLRSFPLSGVKTELNTNDLPRGLYLVKVHNAKGETTLKLTKE